MEVTDNLASRPKHSWAGWKLWAGGKRRRTPHRSGRSRGHRQSCCGPWQPQPSWAVCTPAEYYTSNCTKRPERPLVPFWVPAMEPQRPHLMAL